MLLEFYFIKKLDVKLTSDPFIISVINFGIFGAKEIKRNVILLFI